MLVETGIFLDEEFHIWKGPLLFVTIEYYYYYKKRKAKAKNKHNKKKVKK